MDMTTKNVKPVEINTSIVTDVLNTQCTFIQIFIRKNLSMVFVAPMKNRSNNNYQVINSSVFLRGKSSSDSNSIFISFSS